MRKNLSKHWPMAMLILLIIFFQSTLICCRAPEPIIIPVEEGVIQRLENGNWEVTAEFLTRHFRTAALYQLVKIKLGECEKKLKEK